MLKNHTSIFIQSPKKMDVEISTVETLKGDQFNLLLTQEQKVYQNNALINEGLETNPEKQQHCEGNRENSEMKVKDKPKKKHRRGARKKHRIKYKPYNKLTWDEKRKLDEKDAVKAVRRREELVAKKGRPIAPYNTTQFLMEEHDPGDKNLQQQNHHSSTSSAEGNTKEVNDNEESCSSCSSDEYFEKDFDEFYERIHIDTLNSYTKEDLIKNVYDLEQRIESLERQLKQYDLKDMNSQEEIKRLTKENQELREKEK